MAKSTDLKKYFKNFDEDKRQFAYDTIAEYLFFKAKIEELKKLPLIQVSSKNPAMQRITSAGKLIKDYSAVVDAKRSTLLRILNSAENTAVDEFLQKLSEFE